MRRWVAVAVVLGAIGVLVTALWTPLLGVRSVDVAGVRGLTVAQVETAADIHDGTPMLRLDTVGIITRVAQLPRVAWVDVTREWPSTVRITVTERDPIGVLTKADGAHLVDSTGLDYATVAVAPTGLPKIQLPTAAPTDQRTRAVVRVMSALPGQLRMNPGRVAELNSTFPQAGFNERAVIAPGTQSARMSTGLELQVLLPVVNAPFRIYWAYNPMLVRTYLQPPIVADRSYFPNNATFLNSIATYGGAQPFFEKHSTFKFTIGRTF